MLCTHSVPQFHRSGSLVLWDGMGAWHYSLSTSLAVVVVSVVVLSLAHIDSTACSDCRKYHLMHALNIKSTRRENHSLASKILLMGLINLAGAFPFFHLPRWSKSCRIAQPTICGVEMPIIDNNLVCSDYRSLVSFFYFFYFCWAIPAVWILIPNLVFN